MKSLVLAVALIFSVTATAQTTDAGSALKPNPVSVVLTVVPWLLKEREQYWFATVRGYGRTVDEARTQALRAGVDQAVGTVVNSEREVVDQKLTRSEVVDYASGFVDRYEVKKVEQQGEFVAVTVDLWVRRNRLSDRLLGSHPTKINSDQIQTQAESLDRARGNGARLLNTVLADFPRRAFDIEQGPSNVYYNEHRQRQLVLSFKLRWRHEYLESLREAMSAVAQNANAGDCVGRYHRSCQHIGYLTIKARPGVHGWSRTAGFDDAQTVALIEQNLLHSRPAVLITISDPRGRAIWSGCQRWSELDNVESGYVPNERLLQPVGSSVQINGYLTLDARVPFNLTETTPAIDQVKMQVVRNSACPV